MYKNLRVFNFAILLYSRNSRKLSARKNLVFYSSSMVQFEINIMLSKYHQQ